MVDGEMSTANCQLYLYVDLNGGRQVVYDERLYEVHYERCRSLSPVLRHKSV